jgi:hypothetical protein
MLSHKELKIKKKEYEALIEVERGLRAGEYKHGSPYTEEMSESVKISKDQISEKFFDINLSSEVDLNNCGTVACIGGWVSFMMQGKTFDTNKASEYVCYDTRTDSELYKLYYPDNIAWSDVTPMIAANAIRGYLNTGTVDWVKAKNAGEGV